MSLSNLTTHITTSEEENLLPSHVVWHEWFVYRLSNELTFREDVAYFYFHANHNGQMQKKCKSYFEYVKVGFFKLNHKSRLMQEDSIIAQKIIHILTHADFFNVEKLTFYWPTCLLPGACETAARCKRTYIRIYNILLHCL